MSNPAILRPTRPVADRALVALALSLAWACGGGGAPASSTPPTTTPAPTPAPTPVASDPFFDASCRLGEGDADASCSHASEKMLNVYEDSLDQLIEQSPGIFDLTDEYAPGTKAYRVKDKEAYMNGLVSVVRGRGLCAERDPDDGAQETIRMKLGNEFSENYDVILGNGYMRRGGGAYRESCAPANFPVERSGDVPPLGSGCGRPYPPPVTRFNCKLHLRGPEYYTLDSTPIVGHDAAYCAEVGYPAGTSLCPVRPWGWPDKQACEAWRVGIAKDTGRPGPTWRNEAGAFCTGPESGCQNHPDNQFALLTFRSGTYTVCSENGACCSVSH